MLVTFTNPADPKSVTRVDPNQLTASFGPGYALEAITVEVTKDKVTRGIEGKLAWLTNGSVMQNPRWGRLPYESRIVISSLTRGFKG